MIGGQENHPDASKRSDRQKERMNFTFRRKKETLLLSFKNMDFFHLIKLDHL